MFAAAAAPYPAPKIEGWTDVHIPFVVAAVAAVAGAAVIASRRHHLAGAGHPIPGPEPAVAARASA